MPTENAVHDHDDGCDCVCHGASRMEYRMVRGTNFEGVSIRDIYYDENDNIIGWGILPLTFLAAKPEDIRADLVDAMKHIDDMLEATNKPMLDEERMEEKLDNQLKHE